MSDKVEYTFNSKGVYNGDVTGERYNYSPGDTVVAPEGEFKNEDSAFYQTRPMRAGSSPPEDEEVEDDSEEDKAEDKPDDGVVHTGSGWYEVRIGGETVGKERGKEAAEERYQELQSEV